jgi:hypothetical protein
MSVRAREFVVRLRYWLGAMSPVIGDTTQRAPTLPVES